MFYNIHILMKNLSCGRFVISWMLTVCQAQANVLLGFKTLILQKNGLKRLSNGKKIVILQSYRKRLRKDAGVVDRDGLENRCTLTGTEGSNPSLSANHQSASALTLKVRADLLFQYNSCTRKIP